MMMLVMMMMMVTLLEDVGFDAWGTVRAIDMAKYATALTAQI